MVDVRSGVFRVCEKIGINLDGARFDLRTLPFTNREGETKPAFEAALVTASGRHISVYGVAIDLRMETCDVVFHKGADAKGDAVLVAHKAREGQLVLSAAHLGLEEAIGRIAGGRARLYAIDLERVRLAMRARDPG